MIYSFHIVYYTLRRISCNTNFTDSGQGNIIIRSTIKVETIPKIERRNNGDHIGTKISSLATNHGCLSGA